MKGQSSVRGEEEITRKVREKPRETNIRESPIGYCLQIVSCEEYQTLYTVERLFIVTEQRRTARILRVEK